MVWDPSRKVTYLFGGFTSQPLPDLWEWDGRAGTWTQRAAFTKELQALHTYMGMREAAKHYLMHGYALVRHYLVELDRRRVDVVVGLHATAAEPV